MMTFLFFTASDILASTSMLENRHFSHFGIFLRFPTAMWWPWKVSTAAILLYPLELLNIMQREKEALKNSYFSWRCDNAKYWKCNVRDASQMYIWMQKLMQNTWNNSERVLEMSFWCRFASRQIFS